MTIYAVTIGGRKRWRVDWTSGGVRRCRTFTARADADACLAELRDQQRAAGEAWSALTVAERNELIRLHQLASERGVTLDAVWRAYVAAGAPEASVEMSAAFRELLAAKAAAGRNPEYLYNLTYCVGRFVEAHANEPVATVGVEAVDAYLCEFSTGYRATMRSRLSTFFEFCRRRGWCRENPCDRLEPVAISHAPPRVFTLPEALAMLRWFTKHKRGLAWFVLTCLCGLRPDEARKTSWSSVDLSAGLVRVEAQTSKVRRRRVVYPLPAALAWLSKAKALGSALPVPKSTIRGYQRTAARECGLNRWPHDVTRHTAASYWLPISDPPHVAEMLGHSVATLKQHYRALVSRQDAENFWRECEALATV